jgi:hypothetical protein
MLARIIGGLSKANVAVILAIVSDTTTDRERNRAMVCIKYPDNYIREKKETIVSIFIKR